MTLFCHRSKQSILSCLFYHLSVFKWHLCGCHMWSMVTKESYYVPKSKKGTSVLMYRKHNCTYTFTVSHLYVYQMYMQCFTWCTQHAYLHNPCTTFTILTNFYYKLRWVSPRLSLHWFSVFSCLNRKRIKIRSFVFYDHLFFHQGAYGNN